MFQAPKASRASGILVDVYRDDAAMRRLYRSLGRSDVLEERIHLAA